MKRRSKGPEHGPDELRRLAAARLAERRGGAGTGDAELPGALALVQELQIHEIELELQNQELARARLELEVTLASYTDLYEHAPVGYVTLGRDGKLGRVNLTGARLLGVERSALVDRPLRLLFAPESRSAFDAFAAPLLERRTERAACVVVRVAAEPSRMLELTGTALPDGETCRVVLADVSERQAAERLAHMRGRRAQALADLFRLPPGTEEAIVAAALEALVALTESKLGLIGFVDEAESTLTAHTWSAPAMGERAAIDGPLVFELGAGGLWAAAVTKRAPVIVNDYAAAGSMAKGHPARHVALRRFLGVPLVRVGRVVLVAGLANREEAYADDDAIEAAVFLEGLWEMLVRRRAEQKLLASETKYRTLHDSSADAVMLLTDGIVFDCNPAAVRMFGARDRSQLCGLRFGAFEAPTQAEPSAAGTSVEARIAEAMAVGSCRFEWVHGRLDGAERFVADVRLSRMVIDGRQVLQATARDTTEQKRLQASLAQADRLASMGMLAAGVAHEINNPLSYVLFNLETLVDDLPTLALDVKRELGDPREGRAAAPRAARSASALDDAIACARDALAGTRRIREIAGNLGTFSRAERTERTGVDVRQAVERALTIAHSEIRYRARLVQKLDEVPSVWASEGKLAQIFLNLLINAAHAIDEGHAEAHAITVRTRLAGGRVVVDVSDTGRGIAPDDLGRIFEPFFTTQAVGKGSGLGLSICRDLVTEFGGEIRVESQVGRGTTLSVHLPVAPAAVAEPSVSEVATTSPHSALRGRVLVVDDEPQLRVVMARILGREHEVVAVASGRAAQSVLATDRAFDVIVCDVMMPEMTGVELHAWLLGEDAALAARLVFVSGGAFTPHASRYLAAVPNRTVAKPIDATQMRAVVAEFVAAARASAEGP